MTELLLLRLPPSIHMGVLAAKSLGLLKLAMDGKDI